MTFEEALKELGIEKYSDRIVHSNSRGELVHIPQYYILADMLKGEDWFSEWFESLIKYAEESWDRPESIFQHVLDIFMKVIKEYNNK